MIHSQIEFTHAGNFEVKESIFDNNGGVRVTNSGSNLFVESCFFRSCFSKQGGGLHFASSSGNVYFSKLCGVKCYVINGGVYGIFYSVYGNQTVDQLSYSDDSVRTNQRDTLNHEAGQQHINYANVSNMRTSYRGFAWISPQGSGTTSISHTCAYNISCNCELMHLYSGKSATLYRFTMTGCVSGTASSIGDNAGFCLIGSRIPYTLNECSFFNNQFNSLFSSTPTIVGGSISYKSSASGETIPKTDYIN